MHPYVYTTVEGAQIPHIVSLAEIGQWQPPQQANTDSLPLTSPPPSTLTSTKSLCYSYFSHTIHHCLWSLCFHHVLSWIVVVKKNTRIRVCISPALPLPLPIMTMTMWEEAHNRKWQIIKNWPIYSISSTGASPPPGPCWLGLIFSFDVYIHHCQICHNIWCLLLTKGYLLQARELQLHVNLCCARIGKCDLCSEQHRKSGQTLSMYSVGRALTNHWIVVCGVTAIPTSSGSLVLLHPHLGAIIGLSKQNNLKIWRKKQVLAKPCSMLYLHHPHIDRIALEEAAKKSKQLILCVTNTGENIWWTLFSWGVEVTLRWGHKNLKRRFHAWFGPWDLVGTALCVLC